jgi:hypothetical protein
VEVAPYAPGESVYVYLEEESITMTGVVVACPTKRQAYYRIRLEDDMVLQANPEAVWNDNDEAYMNAEYDPSNPGDDPMMPSWLSEGCGITLKTPEGYKRGTLTVDEEGDWVLAACTADTDQGRRPFPLSSRGFVFHLAAPNDGAYVDSWVAGGSVYCRDECLATTQRGTPG